MQDKKRLHLDLSELILKCCFDVIKELGSGFLESVYKNALFIALKQEGLLVDSEKSYEVFFRGVKIGLYRADLVVENKVVVELKCCENLSSEHQAQAINYLKSSGIPIALLVNFGNRKLQIRRLYHPAYPAGEAVPTYPVF